VLTPVLKLLFTLVKFVPLSLNFIVKAGAENFILRTEGGVQNLFNSTTAPKALHFKVLAFNPFRTHGVAHALTVMLGSGVTWV